MSYQVQFFLYFRLLNQKNSNIVSIWKKLASLTILLELLLDSIKNLTNQITQFNI
jgi:hypothetical protein